MRYDRTDGTYESHGKGGVVPAAAFGRGSGAGEKRAGHAADARADLSPRLDRRIVHDPARTARGAPATRAPETGDDTCRAGHSLDGGDVRRRAHSGTGR